MLWVLNETVLLSTQNMLKLMGKIYTKILFENYNLFPWIYTLDRPKFNV